MDTLASLKAERFAVLPPNHLGKILIVEDSHAIATVLTRLLDREGYQTSLCSSAPEAKRFIAAENIAEFGLVLLDINLPGGTGFDILQVLRESSKVPVIMVSALKQDHNIERGFELGAQDFMTKPFNPRELLLRVKQHMTVT